MIDNGYFKRFESKEQVWDWWTSKLGIDDYFMQKFIEKTQLKLDL